MSMTLLAVEEEIIKALRATPKYGTLCEETLARMAVWASARHKAPKDAIKAAKKKLHQAYGAYLESWDFRGVAREVAEIPTDPNPEEIRATCNSILKHHASTRERMGIVEEAFPNILNGLEKVESIMDLACGLGPFMLPWIDPENRFEYRCSDIDARLADIENEFLEKIGRPRFAECHDLLASTPSNNVDVVFLFKVLPCLEQQEKGAGKRVLSELPARYAIASFPTRSLGGFNKGMSENYDRYARSLAEELGLEVNKTEYASESFYTYKLR